MILTKPSVHLPCCSLHDTLLFSIGTRQILGVHLNLYIVTKKFLWKKKFGVSPKSKLIFFFRKLTFQRFNSSKRTLIISLWKFVYFSALLESFNTLAALRWPFSVSVMAADSRGEIIIYNGGAVGAAWCNGSPLHLHLDCSGAGVEARDALQGLVQSDHISNSPGSLH